MDDIVDRLTEMGESGFLSGDPEGDREIEVDDVFAKDWDRAHGEMTRHEPGWERIAWEMAEVTASDHEGFAFVQSDAGLLLLDLGGPRIVGGFIGGADLVLHRDYRGRGLGMEIVQEFYARNDGLPTWWHDRSAYSRQGEAVCRRAYRDFLARPDAARARARRVAEVVPGTFVPDREPILLFEVGDTPVVLA